MNVVHKRHQVLPCDAMIKISHSTASASDGFIELTIEDQGPGVQAQSATMSSNVFTRAQDDRRQS